MKKYFNIKKPAVITTDNGEYYLKEYVDDLVKTAHNNGVVKGAKIELHLAILDNRIPPLSEQEQSEIKDRFKRFFV